MAQATDIPGRFVAAAAMVRGGFRHLVVLDGREGLFQRLEELEHERELGEQEDAHEPPVQAAQHDAAIARVRGAFEFANPGYTLHVNPEVRSLEIQLERWNTNATIAVAAAVLAEAAATTVRSERFPAPDNPLAQAVFGDFLHDWVPSPMPPLAAPGLSAHGQMRAVDFVVTQGDRIVAGAVTADIPAIWTGQGWAERLKAAVLASGAPFVGPLRYPDEPWHFDYRL